MNWHALQAHCPAADECIAGHTDCQKRMQSKYVRPKSLQQRQTTAEPKHRVSQLSPTSSAGGTRRFKNHLCVFTGRMLRSQHNTLLGKT